MGFSGSGTISGSCDVKESTVPSCLDAWHICGPVGGLGRRLSRFLSSAPGGFPLHGPRVCPR